jgi:hypothetical protein
MKPFINEEQTSNVRKFKYAYARQRGVSKALAQRMRDWHLKGFIGQMSKQTGMEYPHEHINFYVELAKAKIEIWRAGHNEARKELELTP